MTVQTSTTVTIDVTFRVTADLDELTAHLGGDVLNDPEDALQQHITWPIVDNSFDTPATVELVSWSGDAA